MTTLKDGSSFEEKKIHIQSDPYDYNRFGAKGKRVGQAALDLISKDQPYQTAGDTIDAFGPRYAEEVQKTVEQNRKKYHSPFYLLVFTKKEYLIINAVRNWFVARQTAPYAFDMMQQYPEHTKTLYIVDAEKGKIKLLWSLPGFSDCITVASNPDIYSPDLVRWIYMCFNNKLNRNTYTFDEDI